MAALLMGVKLSLPKTLMNPLAAETVLVLDELETELIVLQHIQGVLNSEPKIWADSRRERRFPHHSSRPRVDARITRQGHVSLFASRE